MYLPLLVLDLCLYVVDSVRGLDLEGDGLAGESLHENLHVECCGLGMSRSVRKGGFISPSSEIEIGTAMLSQTTHNPDRFGVLPEQSKQAQKRFNCGRSDIVP